MRRMIIAGLLAMDSARGDEYKMVQTMEVGKELTVNQVTGRELYFRTRYKNYIHD